MSRMSLCLLLFACSIAYAEPEHSSIENQQPLLVIKRKISKKPATEAPWTPIIKNGASTLARKSGEIQITKAESHHFPQSVFSAPSFTEAIVGHLKNKDLTPSASNTNAAAATLPPPTSTSTKATFTRNPTTHVQTPADLLNVLDLLDKNEGASSNTENKYAPLKAQMSNYDNILSVVSANVKKAQSQSHKPTSPTFRKDVFPPENSEIPYGERTIIMIKYPPPKKGEKYEGDPILEYSSAGNLDQNHIMNQYQSPALPNPFVPQGNAYGTPKFPGVPAPANSYGTPKLPGVPAPANSYGAPPPAVQNGYNGQSPPATAYGPPASFRPVQKAQPYPQKHYSNNRHYSAKYNEPKDYLKTSFKFGFSNGGFSKRSGDGDPKTWDTKPIVEKMKPCDFGVVVAQNYLFRPLNDWKTMYHHGSINGGKAFNSTSIVYLAKLLAEKRKPSPYWHLKGKKPETKPPFVLVHLETYTKKSNEDKDFFNPGEHSYSNGTIIYPAHYNPSILASTKFEFENLDEVEWVFERPLKQNALGMEKPITPRSGAKIRNFLKFLHKTHTQIHEDGKKRAETAHLIGMSLPKPAFPDSKPLRPDHTNPDEHLWFHTSTLGLRSLMEPQDIMDELYLRRMG